MLWHILWSQYDAYGALVAAVALAVNVVVDVVKARRLDDPR